MEASPSLCHPERTRISCHAAQDTAACAPFSKERRMKFANATKFNRKSGEAEGSAASFPNPSHKAPSAPPAAPLCRRTIRRWPESSPRKGARAGVAAEIRSEKLQPSCSASHAPKTSAASAAFNGFQRPKMTIPSAMNPCPETIDSRKSPTCASTRYAPAMPAERPDQRSQ